MIACALKGKRVFLYSDGIFPMNAWGTDLKVIVSSENGGPFLNPKWSPDKQTITFTSGSSWCADGKQIVFTSDTDGSDELYIVYIDGKGLRRLTNNSIANHCPDW